MSRPRSVWSDMFELRRPISRSTWMSVAVSSLIFGVLLWWLGSTVLAGRADMERPELFLPSPWLVTNAAWNLCLDGEFLRHVWISFYRVSLGFLLAAAFAVPTGLLVGNFGVAEALVAPLNGFARYLPVPALLPLTIVWFGVGDIQKMSVVFLGVFFQLLILVADAAKAVPREFVEVSECLGYSRLAILRKVIVPASAPAVYDACRTTIAWAWSYLVVAELVNHQDGITSLLRAAQRFLQTPRMLALVASIGCIGVLTDLVLRVIGRRAFAWSREELGD